MKAEVENVHEIGARSKADLQYVAEHRAEVVAIKNSIDKVLAQIGETDEKLSVIMGRKRLVDEVEAKTQMITNLLADVHVNLEALGEQKSLVDHLSEKLARFDFMTQEAQTLSTLSGRELAERLGRISSCVGPGAKSKSTSVRLPPVHICCAVAKTVGDRRFGSDCR